MNPLRRIERKQMRDMVDDFKRQEKFNEQMLSGLCVMYKQPVSLKGKLASIVELQIDAMKAKVKAQAEAAETATTSTEVDNG